MGIFDKFTKSNGSNEDVSIPEIAVEKNESIIEGKIIKLFSTKGYGFISAIDIPFTRIFFHWSALRPNTLHFTELEEGMKVKFRPIEVPQKGWRALNVEVIEKTSFTSPGHEL